MDTWLSKIQSVVPYTLLSLGALSNRVGWVRLGWAVLVWLGWAGLELGWGWAGLGLGVVGCGVDVG